MSRKIFLVTFADYRFRNSLKRLEIQTRRFPFDNRFFLTERNCLSRDFWRKLKPWLYRRGYGYWAWKSALVQYYLQNLDEGDILIYSDAGICWNDRPNALKRFEEYTKMLAEEYDILVFCQPTIEKEWTKGDIFNAIGVYENEMILNSCQFWGGCFMLKKTSNTVSFINRFVDLCDIRKELITDKRSTVPNKEGFIEHRHDQSVFSVLVKTVPHIAIPWQETQVYDGNWDTLADYPIQAKRVKLQERPWFEIMKNKALRPWRNLLGFYFTKIRDYEFVGKHYSW